MTFDGDGVLTYKDKDNAWHRKLPDGSETVKYTDGTFARLDHEGRTTRVGIDNKHYLEYVRDDTGKLLQVNRVFPMQNSELWNAASRRPGEVLADGTFRHTDDEGRAILECRDLRSNLFEKAPSRDGVTPLLSQVTLPSGEKCAFEYGDDRDNQHPKRITFTHTERRRGQDGIVTRVLEALPTSGDVPDRANTPGQRVAPMQLYGMTSTIRFDQPPFDPFVAERRENIPNLYCALTVRPNGDVEATSYDRGAGRYVFHGNRIGNSNHVTKVTEGGERFLTAKRDFDRLFEREVATLLREAREDGRDLLSKDTKLEAKQRLARNLYLNHVTGQLRPLLADLEDSRMPARGLPKRDYHTKAKELEAARAILEERLRARREELGS